MSIDKVAFEAFAEELVEIEKTARSKNVRQQLSRLASDPRADHNAHWYARDRTFTTVDNKLNQKNRQRAKSTAGEASKWNYERNRVFADHSQAHLPYNARSNIGFAKTAPKAKEVSALSAIRAAPGMKEKLKTVGRLTGIGQGPTRHTVLADGRVMRGSEVVANSTRELLQKNLKKPNKSPWSDASKAKGALKNLAAKAKNLF